uniref:BTB/POZ domain-containing protein At1g55760-like n=1 Tax=Erigeron canadensis TaxID=72917 RepID=UPI001CB94FEF|nr:BTB/POZ domain-containing protein At1g55760-like [Erigeron canadensis]
MASSSSIHRVDMLCRLVQWRVDNYDYLTWLDSNPFKMGRWNWCLTVYKNQICLYTKSSEVTHLFASFNIHLVSFLDNGNRSTSVYPEVRDLKLFKVASDFYFFWALTTPLTRKFIIEVNFVDIKTASPEDAIPRSVWSEELIENPTTCALSRMLSENLHTDITIWASDGSVQAHRAVLATRSPVFDKMFTHNLKEKDSFSIDIPDISIEACKAFLTYIYTNNTQSESFIIHRMELLKAADKYDVSDLKDACVKSLSEDIDQGNVLERLQSAYLYRLPELKGICIDHLVKFGKIFDIQEELNAFMQNADRELVSEVFYEILSVWKGFCISC